MFIWGVTVITRVVSFSSRSLKDLVKLNYKYFELGSKVLEGISGKNLQDIRVLKLLEASTRLQNLTKKYK